MEIKTPTAFEKEVMQGLSSYPKKIASKFIYDERGDELFQQIMSLPDYYLTNCELNIIQDNCKNICAEFNDEQGFDLIELGAGDGKKTKVLLRELSKQEVQFSYLPIDISQNSLTELHKDISLELPKIDMQPQQGMYFDVLKELSQYQKRKKVILVLGSNIGNLSHPEAIDFLQQISESMHPQDLLFMGFDQKKDPEIILKAYDDPSGITAAFNKNVLARMNTELHADFDLSKFKHWETYNPETGTAESFLISLEKQEVRLEKLNLKIEFKQWESIHTEISQKYDDGIVEWLAGEANLKIEYSFQDEKGYFKNYIFKRISG